MNLGVPPTERNARTGEFTPPGIASCARLKSSSDLVTTQGYRGPPLRAPVDGHDALPPLVNATLPDNRGVRHHPAVMAGAIGVLGVLAGALLYRSARKRLS